MNLEHEPSATATSRRQWLGAAATWSVGVTAAAWVRHARAADTARFPLGVASGYPQPDSVVLWTRLIGEDLPAEVPVQWEMAADEAFTRIVQRGSDTAQAQWAHSVHVQPRGLEPSRPYWYRFSALGDRSTTGRTLTAPHPASPARGQMLRFAIASCQRWDWGHFAAWRDIAAFDPHLVVFLGDYIYEYATAVGALRSVEGGRVDTLAGYRDRYRQYRSDPALQAAHAQCPWVMVWDDHEVENDYAGSQSPRRQAGFEAQRAAAYQAYWEHMPFPASWRPRHTHMRLYGHLDWGPLGRFLLLDDRQYRDPQACPMPGWGGSHRLNPLTCAELHDPRRSLLGLAQEQWLAQSWGREHRWNFLAQQTLMAPMGLRNARDELSVWSDGWDGYPASRERLLQSAAHQQVPGLVVLGGDIHAHCVARLHARPTDASSAVIGSEFCGTSISSRGPSQNSMERARADNPHLLFGETRKRGSMLFVADEHRLWADLRGVDNVADPQSRSRSLARFVVEAAHPGPVAA